MVFVFYLLILVSSTISISDDFLVLEQHDGYHQWSRNCLPFGSTRVHPHFSGIRVIRSVVFYEVLCRSLFVLLAVGLYVLFWFTYSDYPLVSSNSSQNNHILFTLDVIQRLFSMRNNMCSSWYEGDNCRVDGWLGVISKMQWTIFSVSLIEDYEIRSWLSLKYLLPVVNPITVLLSPLGF